MEDRLVQLLRVDGSTLPATFILEDEVEGDEDSVRLTLEFVNGLESRISDSGFFDALCEIRKMLDKDGLRPICFGACENVYPSPMIASMGDGELAYRLELGKPALKADLVNIFDCDELVQPSSVKAQEEFYERWIQSLRLFPVDSHLRQQ